MSAARARTPVCSVVDADGVVVGCGQGLDGAQEDALERAVRLREARLGRPLRPGEREELEVWAAALGLAPAVEAPSASAAAHLTAAEAGADAAEPAPGPAFSCATPRRVRWRGPALGQVLLFPELGPPLATARAGPGRRSKWWAGSACPRPRVDPAVRSPCWCGT